MSLTLTLKRRESAVVGSDEKELISLFNTNQCVTSLRFRSLLTLWDVNPTSDSKPNLWIFLIGLKFHFTNNKINFCQWQIVKDNFLKDMEDNVLTYSHTFILVSKSSISQVANLLYYYVWFKVLTLFKWMKNETK